MHLFDGKNVILRPKNGLVFKLRPQLTAFYLGQTPVSQFLPYHLSVMTLYGKRQGEIPPAALSGINERFVTAASVIVRRAMSFSPSPA